MKVFVDHDEVYPFYSLCTEQHWGSRGVEVTDAEWERYNKYCLEYEYMQHWLSGLSEMVRRPQINMERTPEEQEAMKEPLKRDLANWPKTVNDTSN